MAAHPGDTSNSARSQEEMLFHEWNAEQLEQLGIRPEVAVAVADTVDWMEIAELVSRGCSPELAVQIAR
jgi:hypothetical protein